MESLPVPTAGFVGKKSAILSQLSVPDSEYTDASPKGSVDAGIRHLIDEINECAGLVTTSSCAGRVSVYLEGRKKTAEGPADSAGEGEEAEVQASSAGGKGGGEWLFVSHDPLDELEDGYETLFGLREADREAVCSPAGQAAIRLIHFKFEPMILHVFTASHQHAQLVIQAGMEAGFRETGAVSLLEHRPDEAATPIVAVRSMGLSFESLIGFEDDKYRGCFVSPEYLKTLVGIANERLTENQKRIARFQLALKSALVPKRPKDWEDAGTRRERKRQEGLKRRGQMRKESEPTEDQVDMDLILQEPDVL